MEKRSQSTFTWSRNETEQLISLYKQHPVLWSVRLKDYHNKNVRQTALQEICTAINEANLCSLNTADISKKIHGLRTTFLAELNKIKKSETSGTSTDQIYKPKWLYFDMLRFVNNTRPEQSYFEEDTVKNEDTELLYEGSLDDLNETFIMSPSSSSRGDSRLSDRDTDGNPPKRAKYVEEATRKSRDAQMERLLSSATTTLERIQSLNSTKDCDSNVYFGRMLVAEMSKINEEEILDLLKEDIMAALFKAKKMAREREK